MTQVKLEKHELVRYSRQLLLKEIGLNGQLKLKSAKVLVVGAGGLGSAALLYLSAAGVGKIGIVDFDIVEESNLQRQVLYSSEDVGQPKAIQAAERLKERNVFVEYMVFQQQLSTENTLELFSDFNIILDCTDNLATRYMLNDACVLLNKTLIHGSVSRYDGQVAVFNHLIKNGIRSATYRCIFPDAPDPLTVQTCTDSGVLGVLPGIIGTCQATEALKLITGIGEPLSDKLLLFNALTMDFTTFQISRNENNWKEMPATSDQFREMNYELFCDKKMNVLHSERATFSETVDAIRHE